MKSFFRLHWKTLVIFGFLLLVFLLNTFHEEYPDEFDSLVGGRYINSGLLQYRDWFQHHQPGAYVMAAIILPFTGISFVKFRVAWATVIFGINSLGYYVLRKRMPRKDLTFYLILLFTIALAGTYFWWHMLLADTLAAYLLLPAFSLLFMKDYYREKLNLSDLMLITGFTFLSWFTSMTYIYIVAAISLYTIGLYVARRKRNTSPTTSLLASVGVTTAPYVLFVLWLVVSGSLKDWYFASIYYNQAYYIYNYPHAPGTLVNPIRYAVVIFDDFVNNYMLALGGVTGWPLSNPIQLTFALSSFVAILLVILTGRWMFLFPLLVTLVYSNARSNPQSIRETDYQSAAYIITSMFNGLFSISALKELVDSKKLALSSTIAASALMLVLGVYWIATPLYFGQHMMLKYYDKYMGKAPLIYDRPVVAPIVNQLITKNDYLWIGPFNFKELFYLRTTKLPSKYHWFLQHAASSKIKDELIADLTRNRPKIIVFDRGYAPWGGDPHGYNYFMTDFLDKYYFRIFKLNDTLKGEKYIWNIHPDFDIDGQMNFDVARKDEIMSELLTKGLLEKVSMR